MRRTPGVMQSSRRTNSGLSGAPPEDPAETRKGSKTTRRRGQWRKAAGRAGPFGGQKREVKCVKSDWRAGREERQCTTMDFWRTDGQGGVGLGRGRPRGDDMARRVTSQGDPSEASRRSSRRVRVRRTLSRGDLGASSVWPLGLIFLAFA